MSKIAEHVAKEFNDILEGLRAELETSMAARLRQYNKNHLRDYHTDKPVDVPEPWVPKVGELVECVQPESPTALGHKGWLSQVTFSSDGCIMVKALPGVYFLNECFRPWRP